MRLQTLSAVAIGLAFGLHAGAGSYNNDFTSTAGTGLSFNGSGTYPAGSETTFLPRIESGHLVLTYAENSLQGTVIVDDLDGGARVSAFTANFKVRIGGGSSTPADGFSVHYGNNVDAAANFGEEGPGGGVADTSGITVCWDTFDNGGAEAPAIDIKLNGEVVSHNPMGIFDIINDTFTPVTMELKATGQFSVSYKGKIYSTFLTGWAPISGGRFALGARTGGLNANHWIDDLALTTTPLAAAAPPVVTTQPASKTVDERQPVTFSAEFTGTAPLTFQWFKNDAPIAGATSPTLSIAAASFGDNGAKYKVEIKNTQGTAVSDAATLTVNQDAAAPTIASAAGNDGFNAVTLRFSEPVTAASAGSLGNYSIQGLSISAATVVSPTEVRLTTGSQTPGNSYTLTINGIKDTAFVANTIAADTKVVIQAWVLSAGFLKFEFFAGIAGNTVQELIDSPKYQANTPDVLNGKTANYIAGFDSRLIFPTDATETFGARITGFVTPNQSGDYRFFARSDDASQLSLSSDGSPASLQVIALETGCCEGFKEPDTEETSAPISLVAGRSYFVEFLYKEGTGGDFGQVAWRREGDPAPAGALTPIGSAFIGAYADPGAATISFTQQPAAVSTTENKTASFSVATTVAPGPTAYQWQRAEPGSDTFASLAGATGAAYTTPTLKRATDNGAKYRVMVATPGKAESSAAATLAVEIDSTPPQLVSAIGGSNLRGVTLGFSEPVEAASAGTAGNYAIAGLTVEAARVTGPTTVVLTTSAQTADTAYTVVATGVKDTAIPANTVAPPANTAGFRSLIFITGALRWDAYLNMGGVVISTLTSDPRYPASPNDTRLLPGFEGQVGYTDNYGARISGFISPKTTGNYVFFVAADDNAELWLSTDDFAENKVKIAVEPNWADPRQWTGTGGGGRPGCDSGACENTSKPIRLEAGKRYYAELLYKEGGGGDHGAVAWKAEGAADPENGSTPIYGDVLSVGVDRATYDRFTLPLASRTDTGSGVANQRGFNARIHQVDQQGATAIANHMAAAEQQLAGIIGANVADLTGATAGVFAVNGVINWNQEMNTGGNSTEVGNFTSANGAADLPLPGIPGTGTASHNLDSIASDVMAYVEFPTAGVYALGVNSDDGFKVMASDQSPSSNGALVIAGGPAAGAYYAVSAGFDGGGISRPITAPITGKLVLANPLPACDPITNGDAIKGNIAVIDRGVCTFSSKIQNAINAGAVAVVIVNSRDPGSADGIYPIVMGGTIVEGPSVMISKPDGIKIKEAAAAGETLASITPEPAQWLARYNYGRGATDSIFAVNVPQPGVYPLRLTWQEGGGGANVEYFSLSADGATRILVNDTAATALKAFRARTGALPKPTVEIAVDGVGLKITYTGTLEASTSATGGWAPVPEATSPYRPPAGKQAEYFRSRR